MPGSRCLQRPQPAPAEAGASLFKLTEVSRHKSLDTLLGYVRRSCTAEYLGEEGLRPFCKRIVSTRWRGGCGRLRPSANDASYLSGHRLQ
jgi:hypothetical protein